jgi:N-acetylglutamate synthase-like GNAT family acetyltransferase
MQNNIEIKQYSKNYQQQVVQLILTIQTEEFNIPISIEGQPDLLNIEAFYQIGVGNFWIATMNKKVVGTIALLDIGNQQVALRKMFVDKLYRGKEYGVAKDLLETAFAFSKEKDIHTIYLGTTSAFLAAHRFYEKNGFKEINKNALPAAFPILSIDSKFYRYNI